VSPHEESFLQQKTVKITKIIKTIFNLCTSLHFLAVVPACILIIIEIYICTQSHTKENIRKNRLFYLVIWNKHEVKIKNTQHKSKNDT
jgi:hypothetical protein